MPRTLVLNRNRGGGGGKIPSRALLLALLTALAALIALTLSTSAQTPADELDSAEGRIIARVQDRTGEDGVDDYRIEFGFFPEWTLDEAGPWSAAIASRSDSLPSSWLPSSRFLTKSRIDARAAADDRSWLRSSLIFVPAQSPRSLGGDDTEIEIIGRVIARYNPDSEGRLRIEFGFVPEWAFADTSSTEEAVERLGADGLPSARYLRAAAIDDRRGVWLRSSVISVPLRAPVVVIEQPQAPVIDAINCSPASPTVDESVTCTATLSGDAPDSYAWSGGSAAGGSDSYITSFDEAGEHTVSLTVANSAGSDTESTTLTITEPLQPPAIDAINCSSASPAVDESVTCTATLSGGAPDSWTWSGGSDNGDGDSYTTSFSEAGEHTVSLTVANSAGSDTESTTVSVSVEETLQAPLIDGINCIPSSPAVGEAITCIAGLSGGAPESYEWRAGSSSGGGETHTTSFSKAGEYTVSLTVANSAGSDTESTTLTVAESAEQPAVQAPIISNINCSPPAPAVNEEITCTAALSGDAPESRAWSGGSSSGSGETYTTSFNGTGEYTVSLTVTNSAGSDTESTTLTVAESAEQPAVQAPIISSINCSPPAPAVNEEITCTATLSGDALESWAWSGGSSSGSGETYTTSFSETGEHAVSLTVTNAAGSDTDSITISVEPPAVQAPIIDSINCTRTRVTVNPFGEVDCTASLSGGAPASWAWSGGNASSRHPERSLYTPSFSAPHGRTVEHTISLTVENAGGSDTGSTTVTVVPAEEALRISCSPATVLVGETVTCQIDSKGYAYQAYSWHTTEPWRSVSPAGSTTSTYSPSFRYPGAKTVKLSVFRRHLNRDANTATTTVTVNLPSGLPRINGINCSPSSPTVGDQVTCTAEISGDAPITWAWKVPRSRYVSNANGSSERFTTSFNRPGAFDVELIVRNAVGGASRPAIVEVLPPSPQIDGITCSPSSPTVGDAVTCTAELGGGMQDAWVSWAWSGGAADAYTAAYSGGSAAYNTSFGSAGSTTVSLTVTNSVGSDTNSIALTVLPPLPVINSINCSPPSPTVDESVTCTANLGGGAPDSYAWSGGAANGDSAAYSASFGSAGSATVSLTVTNRAGSDTESTTVSVVELPETPAIDSITCSPASTNVHRNVICRATLSGGAPDSYTWSSGAGNGSSAEYHARFRTAGSKTVSLTVTNRAGSDTDSTTVSVAEPAPAPVIDSVSCSPESPAVDESVTCTAALSGGAPDSWAWRAVGVGTNYSGTDESFTTSFSSPGLARVILEVRNSTNLDLAHVELTVTPAPP